MWRAGRSAASRRVLEGRPAEKGRRGEALATTCESTGCSCGCGGCSPSAAPSVLLAIHLACSV